MECPITNDTEANVNKVNQEDALRGKREAAITGQLRRKFGGERGESVLNISLSHVILFYRNIFIACGDYVRLS